MSNWAEAIRAGDLAVLSQIIQIVIEWEQQTGRAITPLQLKASLEGR